MHTSSGVDSVDEFGETIVPNKVEAAYRRGNLLEIRRGLMGAWSRYCEGRSIGILRLAS